jgi:hypothetical protein
MLGSSKGIQSLVSVAEGSFELGHVTLILYTVEVNGTILDGIYKTTINTYNVGNDGNIIDVSVDGSTVSLLKVFFFFFCF